MANIPDSTKKMLFSNPLVENLSNNYGGTLRLIDHGTRHCRRPVVNIFMHCGYKT